MENWIKKNYGLLTVAVLLTAAALRLIGLGGLTLSEAESALVHLFEEGQQTAQLLYTLPTALIFRLFGASEFSARLFPALFGIAAVLLPATQRKRFGDTRTLLAACVLAVDPLLLCWSKRADALLPVIVLSLAAFCAWLNGNGAGMWAALLFALTGGSRFYPFFIAACAALFLTWLITWAFSERFEPFTVRLPKCSKRESLTIIVAFLCFVTAFLAYPRGIAALGNGLLFPAEDWIYPGFTAMINALIYYCAVSLILCCMRPFVLRRPVGKWEIGMLAFIFFGFMLNQDLLVLPWLSLVSRLFALDVLIKAFSVFARRRTISFRIGFFFLPACLCFICMRLVEIVNLKDPNAAMTIFSGGTQKTLPFSQSLGYFVIIIVSVIIFLLVDSILKNYFDKKQMTAGSIAGVLAFLAIILMGRIWFAAGFSRTADHPAANSSEARFTLAFGDDWRLNRQVLSTRLREAALKDNGSANRGNVLLTLPDAEPLLDWYFRENERFHQEHPSKEAISRASVVISPTDSDYTADGFVGSRVAWKIRPDWRNFNPQNWFKWVFYNNTKNTVDVQIFWERAEMITK